jgi:hypothetical protein
MPSSMTRLDGVPSLGSLIWEKGGMYNFFKTSWDRSKLRFTRILPNGEILLMVDKVFTDHTGEALKIFELIRDSRGTKKIATRPGLRQWICGQAADAYSSDRPEAAQM